MRIVESELLDLSTIWPTNDVDVFRSDRVVGLDYYYPVYRWENYFSYSPFKLLMLKGYFKPNPDFDNFLEHGRMVYYPPTTQFIDSEIKKVGGPIKKLKPTIKEEAHFSKEIITALKEDIEILEKRHPEANFCILTGGKDSLNLLLLPWKNPVYALSSQPNYQLVKTFCEINELNIPVVELGGEETDTKAMLDRDILFGCCRMGLGDMRWNQCLCDIKFDSKFNGKELILIIGALADAFTTSYHLKWKCFWQETPWFKKGLLKDLFPENYYKTAWLRGAQWQGVCQGIMRESTGILNYSGYQGPSITNLLAKTDLRKAVTRDMRHLIGDSLLGRSVIYPSINPSPPKWKSRDIFSSKFAWLEALRANGNIRIIS